ncbi:unnamed protein product, partial [Effrenium voratum]
EEIADSNACQKKNRSVDLSESGKPKAKRDKTTRAKQLKGETKSASRTEEKKRKAEVVKEFNALNAKVAKIVTYWSRPAVSLSLLTEKKNKNWYCGMPDAGELESSLNFTLRQA